jgi:hypothetical protein
MFAAYEGIRYMSVWGVTFKGTLLCQAFAQWSREVLAEKQQHGKIQGLVQVNELRQRCLL